MPTTVLTPRQVFEDNLRPAELLLRVYQLLSCDTTHTTHDVLDAMRGALGADTDEALLLLLNPAFVGIVRERAHISASTFRKAMLDNLLRQAVAATCTALDAFLPALIRANIGRVISAKGASFLPTDKQTQGFFEGVNFTLIEAVQLTTEADPILRITNKVMLVLQNKALSNSTGLSVAGKLLDIADPWQSISDRLTQPRTALIDLLDATTKRRNDIIHRADRAKTDPDGSVQDISFAWTNQAVDNINNVCLALDELVAERMRLLPTTSPTVP